MNQMTKRIVGLSLENSLYNKMEYETPKICKVARENKSRRTGTGADKDMVCTPSSVFGDDKKYVMVRIW